MTLDVDELKTPVHGKVFKVEPLSGLGGGNLAGLRFELYGCGSITLLISRWLFHSNQFLSVIFSPAYIIC